MKKTIFFLLALLFGASLYLNAPDKGLFTKPKQLKPEETNKSSAISESKITPSKTDNKKQNLNSKNKIIEPSNLPANLKPELKTPNVMNNQQNSFVMADANNLQLEFISEVEDVAWKVKEEDFYRNFYSEWLRTYPETNTEIAIECKSQHCKLRLTSIVEGPESFKALTSFIKKLAESRRPFNLLKYKPTDDFAEIMTERVDG